MTKRLFNSEISCESKFGRRERKKDGELSLIEADELGTQSPDSGESLFGAGQ
jgi:hypothetical protein